MLRQPSNFAEDWAYIVSIRVKLTPKKIATFARVYEPDYWELSGWEDRTVGSDYTKVQEELIKIFNLVERPYLQSKNPNAFTPKEFEERIKTRILSKKFGL